MSGNPSAGEVQEVKQLINDDLLSNAEQAGVDVQAVVSETVSEYPDYGIQTVKRFAESTLTQQLEAQDAESVKGIICGSRDRHGKNWPRRYALIKSDGDHIEASSWDSSIPTADGREVEIPSGAAVEMRLDHDPEYDSYEAAQLDSATQLEHEQLAHRLASVAVTPDQLSRGDEYTTVAVLGEIAYINPQTVFEDGEPQGDGPIMLEDERGRPKPHFEAVLSQDGDTRVRAHVERQRYASPYFAIEDFDKLLPDAQEQFTTPEDQAGFVADAFRGRQVVVVGNVNSYSQTRRDDGSQMTYIDIGVTGIVEIPDSSPGAEAQELNDPTADSTSTESPSNEPSDTGSGDDGSDTQPSGSASQIEEVESDIKTYADLVGLDPSDLSVEVINENTQIEAPDSVIGNVIERMGGDGPDLADADTSATENETSEPVDDPVEACYNDDAGQYKCPQEGCLFGASGKAGLFGHVAGQHVAGDDDPTEWIEAVVMDDA
jgi:hypothetical protein